MLPDHNSSLDECRFPAGVWKQEGEIFLKEQRWLRMLLAECPERASLLLQILGVDFCTDGSRESRPYKDSQLSD
jgi:hypothetical protein